jgi:HAD superfamily hydrolase (TIGR01509 family)
MIDLLDDLHHAQYRTGLLTNAPADLGEANFPRLADSVDAIVLSGRDGVGKPMAKSYELIAERLGLRLDQCFFIDDLAENVEAAKSLGMSGHRFTGDISVLTEALRAAGVSW